MRIIKCDSCGNVISSFDVYARLHYKVHIKVETKTGRESIKKIVRSADFCSFDCYKKFSVELEPMVKQEQSIPKFKCDMCDRVFYSQSALKIHKSLTHV